MSDENGRPTLNELRRTIERELATANREHAAVRVILEAHDERIRGLEETMAQLRGAKTLVGILIGSSVLSVFIGLASLMAALR